MSERERRVREIVVLFLLVLLGGGGGERVRASLSLSRCVWPGPKRGRSWPYP